MAAAAHGLARTALPAVDVLEKVLGRRIPLKVHVDASVCKAAAEKGGSRHMRYLNKTKQIDLLWLRDIVAQTGVDLVKVSTEDNIADILTKPLSGERVRVLREKIGVRPQSPGLPTGGRQAGRLG